MKYTQENHGFTLIEIIVSLALFAVVAVVAVGAFLKIVDADRRAQAIESAVNDTNFALESMVRDIRVGSDYECISTNGNPAPPVGPILQTSGGFNNTHCSSLTSGMMIAFNSSSVDLAYPSCHLIHAYELSGNVLEKAEQQLCPSNPSYQAYSFIPLTSTSSALTIQTFDIKIDGQWPTSGFNTAQPKIFILIAGKVGVSQEDQTSFTLQTTAEQRIMEY
jgi:prepilin-type N-terminal cleavage/methylation domain-containing protein